MEMEWLYRIALTLIPELGPVTVRALVDRFGDATSIFLARQKDVAATDGIGELRAKRIKEWNDFSLAEREIVFLEKNRIQPLFLTDAGYPRRLLHCYDPPTLLYYKGNADLNASRIVSIIGTRNHTDYGKAITEELVAALRPYGVLVVSGLAFGIDAVTHKACLRHGIETIGVLGHGLDTIYPSQHAGMAKDMTERGGLLTEFPKATKPDRHHFPRRNRIVAGISDATVVVETAVKGGSMITAELAYTYNRDLFAVPGRLNDSKSGGCISLVQQNKAAIYTGCGQLVTSLGWDDSPVKQKKPQRLLFIDLTNDEKKITTLLEQRAMSIDELYFNSGLSSSSVAAAILNLELQNVVSALPGKMYQLN